jgi:hypothetical protein
VFFGDIFFREDGLWRADRDTCATVNAGVRIDEKEVVPIWVIGGAGDDAIYGTDFDAIPFPGTY